MKKDPISPVSSQANEASHTPRLEGNGTSFQPQNKKINSKRKQNYPWKSPWRVCFFLFALAFAVVLTINMPVVQKKKWSYDATSNSMVDEKKIEKEANLAEINTTQIDKQANIAKQVNSVEQTASDSQVTSNSQTGTDSQKNSKQIARKTAQEQTAIEKVITKSKSIGRLLLMVGIAAFLGGLMDARSWHLYLGYFLRRITRAARLPEIIGVTMPIALYSNVSANTILMSSHSNNSIPRSALITGGMANSYLSHMSHSLRVMYPVIALIGLPGLLFFTVQFSGGFFIILIAFCINRYKYRHITPDAWVSEFSIEKKILNWKDSIKLGVLRSLALIFRMIYITLPLMLAMEWFIKSGSFDFWDQYIPSHVAKYFPAELMSIVIAQMGGLVQSSGVSANLYSEGLIHQSQILLAMLVASAVGNPIRTLRRNLPTALGVYPPKVAFTIVFTMQMARFIVTLLGSICVIIWMNYFLF